MSQVPACRRGIGEGYQRSDINRYCIRILALHILPPTYTRNLRPACIRCALLAHNSRSPCGWVTSARSM